MQQTSIELISSKGCPYGLACLAALCAAEVDYTFTPVSMRAIPDWVTRLTPKGQVPVLRVGEQAFFESSAICELINELAEGVLLPREPLARAWMRTWSLYVPVLSTLLLHASRAATRDAFETQRAELEAAAQPLERALAEAPAAAPGRVALVDCAYYAFFTRLLHVESHLGAPLVDAPRLRRWARAAVAAIGPLHPVLATHGQRYVERFASEGGYLAGPRTDADDDADAGV